MFINNNYELENIKIKDDDDFFSGEQGDKQAFRVDVKEGNDIENDFVIDPNAPKKETKKINKQKKGFVNFYEKKFSSNDFATEVKVEKDEVENEIAMRVEQMKKDALNALTFGDDLFKNNKTSQANKSTESNNKNTPNNSLKNKSKDQMVQAVKPKQQNPKKQAPKQQAPKRQKPKQQVPKRQKPKQQALKQQMPQQQQRIQQQMPQQQQRIQQQQMVQQQMPQQQQMVQQQMPQQQKMVQQQMPQQQKMVQQQMPQQQQRIQQIQDFNQQIIVDDKINRLANKKQKLIDEKKKAERDKEIANQSKEIIRTELKKLRLQNEELEKENLQLKEKNELLNIENDKVKSSSEDASNILREKAMALQERAKQEISKITDLMQEKFKKDQEDIKKYELQKLFENIIEPIINLEMAINAGKKQSDEVQAYVKGFEMLIIQLDNELNRSGLVKIVPKVGDEFNPNEHHATSVEEGENDKIIKVNKQGYKLHDRVIKPAAVVIGKKTKQK